jgi:hypothetical protein
MRHSILRGLVCLLLFAEITLGTLSTKIRYETTGLGFGRWEYTYDVKNKSLIEGIEEFTIWFDYDLYENLSVETPEPPADDWDEIVVEAEPIFQDDGYYDSLALGVGIGIGQTVRGFSVSFDWLDTGQPGPQFYEIIDPVTFETIDSGWTVPIPESATILLLGIGSLSLLCRKY